MAKLKKADKGFEKLFFEKENKELLGKGLRNFWVIFSILFVTFFAIGFANGSLDYLAKKMEDPFVNWVNVIVPHSKIDKIMAIRDKLNIKDIQSEFNIKKVNGYYKGVLVLTNAKTNESFMTNYRTIELDDPLIEQIFIKENLVLGRPFNKYNEENLSELGIIIKESTLMGLGYNKESTFILMPVKVSDKPEKYIKTPIPIKAIVKNLPGLSDFICTQYFYKIRNYPYKGSIFNPLDEKNLILFTTTDSVNTYKVSDSISSFLTQAGIDTFSTVVVDSGSHQLGYKVYLDFWPSPNNINYIDSVYTLLKDSGNLNLYSNYLRLYDYETKKYRIDDLGRFDYISVNFIDLSKIREFAEYLFDKHEIQIDTVQIAAKENYNFISKLTRIISLILIGFSILSVCLFISNILTKHLEKIKKNIGTLKAFGLSNKVLQMIYIKLIIRFVMVSIFAAFSAAWLIGSIGGMRAILSLIGGTLEPNETYFNLFDYWTLIAIVLIVTISMIVLISAAQRILKRTPGDLIYNR